MENNNISRSPISINLPVSLVLFLFLFLANKYSSSEQLKQQHFIEKKQKGAHVFGRTDSTDFQFLTQNNIEWVTLVAWADQEDYNSPIVRHHNGDSMYIQQSDSSWLRRMERIHHAGFKIFVKPHIWIHAPTEGKWRSDIFPTSEENWKLWKESYRDFILRYARLAQQANAEMFCIGTELSRLSVEKPIFWEVLIQEIRSIYSGKIAYAANWYNEYEKITFWDDLDYIGIQAYFPLVKNKYPSTDQIASGWDKYIPIMESMHKKYNRDIMFTEIGYKSTADSGITPWEWVDDPYNHNKSLSMETQANCYEAFFNTIWKKKWFAGAHLWQLRPDYSDADREHSKFDFTPQGKPAENIIAKGFE